MARRVGGAPVAGGWGLSSLGAADVNFRAAAARAVAFLAHMPPASMVTADSLRSHTRTLMSYTLSPKKVTMGKR